MDISMDVFITFTTENDKDEYIHSTLNYLKYLMECTYDIQNVGKYPKYSRIL